MRDKSSLVLTVVAVLVALDQATKWTVTRLFRYGENVDVLGEVVRFTYILNPGAAFGVSLGPYSRTLFIALALLATGVVGVIVRRTPGEATGRLVGLSLILGGAVGNLIDRLLRPGGVVDFVDVGFGTLRWPVFNVADMGITTGAFLLVILLWAEGRVEPVVADETRRGMAAEGAGGRGTGGKRPEASGS